MQGNCKYLIILCAGTSGSELDEYEDEDDPGYLRLDVVGQEAALGCECGAQGACVHPPPFVVCPSLLLAAPASRRHAAQTSAAPLARPLCSDHRWRPPPCLQLSWTR